ncbi:MAG: ABC transporter permease [Opitutaceae bacterium]|nr:ABC transporter permease [Opitutaceae bacterium]
MDSLWQDLRYGFRGLRNQPAFTALAVLTLGLGIGATSTMYSVIYNVLVDPFPYREAERVVAMQIRNADQPKQSGRNYFSTPEFLDYVEQSTVFEDVIAGGYEEILFTRSDGTELLRAGLVSGNNFTFLGVPAVIGRTLTPADAAPGAPPVAVMSYKVWRKYFNLDASAIGQTYIFNNVPTTIVGVMPERFTKLNSDIYKPIVLDRANAEMADEYFMFQAKLKRGVTIEQAEAELTLLAQRLAKVYPRFYPPKLVVKLVSWVENIVGPFRKTLYTLAAAVGLLLLIACSNVANMLLARAAAREKEMAIRASLGASRWRLVRQLLIESFAIALLGMIVGCAFAYFGTKGLAAAMPEGAIPREAQIRLNLPVLAFSVLIAAMTAVLFGLVPALQTTRLDLVEPLKDARKGGGGGFRRANLRKGLVVFEVALSLVLLAGAGLLIRSFVKLTTVDLGFNPDHVLFSRLPFPRGQYQTGAAKQQFFRQLLPQLSALPGVIAVTPITTLPPFGGPRSEVEIPGRPRTQERWDTIVELCGEGYFRTLGLRLVRGRLLSEVDVNDTRKVAVINQAFVAKYFGREDPIGRSVMMKAFERPGAMHLDHPAFEVIGVVSDARNQGIENTAMPAAYLPYATIGAFERGVMLRTAGDPLALVNALRQQIWAVDRNVAITMTDTLNSFMRQFSYARPLFSLIVLSIFAGVGLVLVVLGVYSVLAYTVSQRTHEIGIRMALGATAPDVLRMVLRMGLQMIGLGVIVGLLSSVNLTNVLAAQVEGNEWVHDPLTLTIVVIFVTGAGLAACYFPARRATRVDPMVALRHE